ncbi:hypothetical protein GGQ79_003821 [Ochrobactrum pecoris]|uniref:Uncharacterized protein n=1 Tax=Brucella pecoris TaxID=867683 RepID=A0AB34YVH2_9HYPH|nr:hypothetical protein [Brucella pecoris]
MVPMFFPSQNKSAIELNVDISITVLLVDEKNYKEYIFCNILI